MSLLFHTQDLGVEGWSPWIVFVAYQCLQAKFTAPPRLSRAGLSQIGTEGLTYTGGGCVDW